MLTLYIHTYVQLKFHTVRRLILPHMITILLKEVVKFLPPVTCDISLLILSRELCFDLSRIYGQCSGGGLAKWFRALGIIFCSKSHLFLSQ